MTQQSFETKKSFVRQTWSRCVCEMFPGVVRVEYHLHDDGGEAAVIRYDTGYLRRVDVTGMDLHETARAILDALGREAA